MDIFPLNASYQFPAHVIEAFSEPPAAVVVEAPAPLTTEDIVVDLSLLLVGLLVRLGVATYVLGEFLLAELKASK
jgi:hypothetical protein